MQSDVLLFRSQQQVQQERPELAPERCQQGRGPRRAGSSMERPRVESLVPSERLVCIDVRAGTGGPHVLLRETRSTGRRTPDRVIKLKRYYTFLFTILHQRQHLYFN